MGLYIGIMEKKMETTIVSYIWFRFQGPEVDRIWGIWRSCYHVPKAIFSLLKGTIKFRDSCLGVWEFMVKYTGHVCCSY